MVQRRSSMTSEDPMPEYLAPYARAVAAYGTGFAALLMCDRRWQEARFSTFAHAIELNGRAIADLGSGRADLLGWLARAGLAWRRYVAVEAVAELHRHAQARHQHQPESTFVQADFVRDTGLFRRLVDEQQVDVMLFSGSLNTLAEADALAVLERAWAALAECPGAVLGFNFLAGGDSWARPQTGLPRRDTRRWFSWACDRTPLLSFHQHYLGAHDATIVMQR